MQSKRLLQRQATAILRRQPAVPGGKMKGMPRAARTSAIRVGRFAVDIHIEDGDVDCLVPHHFQRSCETRNRPDDGMRRVRPPEAARLGFFRPRPRVLTSGHQLSFPSTAESGTSIMQSRPLLLKASRTSPSGSSDKPRSITAEPKPQRSRSFTSGPPFSIHFNRSPLARKRSRLPTNAHLNRRFRQGSVLRRIRGELMEYHSERESRLRFDNEIWAFDCKARIRVGPTRFKVVKDQIAQ
jgi:hypothetical protein